MPNVPTATDLRRWAMKCASEASACADMADRERLLRKRDALLALANNEDWLSGHPVRLESDADIIAFAKRVGRDSKTV